MSTNDDIFAESDSMISKCFPSKFHTINAALRCMDIKSSADTKNLVFHLIDSQNKTAWHVANTVSSRMKNLIAKLSVDTPSETALLSEIREILTDSNHDFECKVLLSPIQTHDLSFSDDVEDFMNEVDQSDVLVLFGSPASLFQIFLTIPSLQKGLLDHLFEVVSRESPFSAQLLAQLRRPVGIRSFFMNIAGVEDAANRLIELIGIVKDHQSKSCILQVLPELIASPIEYSCQDPNSTAICGIIDKLIDLLDGAFILTNDDPSNHVLLTEIIECVNHFPLGVSSLSRLKRAYKDIIVHSAGSLSNQRCIVTIIRSLFASEITKSFSSEDVCEFLSLFHANMRLSDAMTDSNEIFSLYVETLSLIFRSESQFKFEWISYLHRGYSKSGSDKSHLLNDFIILLLAYDSELSVECKNDPSGLLKRKELSLILKTFNFIAERLTKNGAYEFISKSTHIFRQKELYCPLLILTNHLLATDPSSLVHRFVYLVYFSVFELASSGQNQAERVMQDLCNNIRYFYTTEVSAFTKKRTLQSARACLNILLQLSIKYTEKMSSHFDLLVGLLDGIAIEVEGSFLDLEDVRKLFLVLVNIAFGRSGVPYVQDDLLIRIRRLLLDSSNKLKAYGLVGAVILLEVYCKCKKGYQNLGPPNSTPISQAETLQCSQSSVLSRQLSPFSQVTAASEITPSRSSHSHGHLSLKGPGTSLADDSQEVNLPLDSADLDSVTSPPEIFIKPPSRLLLQLVGLVENSVRCSALPTQLKIFWLDELASMFTRLEVECRKSESSKLEAQKFIEWMGSRVMREFQEEFVVDNPPDFDDNNVAQLGLNAPEICEIALNVGPKLVLGPEVAARLPLSTITRNRLANHRASRPLVRLSLTSPALIPSQLRVIAGVESFKSNQTLDAINALLGCPFILPAVALTDLLPLHLIVVINYCTEAVNTFAREILLHSSKNLAAASTRRHPLSSTLTCRLIQIASLRFCLHAVLLQRIKNAALTAVKMELPSPIYELLDTMTFDPAFVHASSGRQACVRRLLLFTPSTGKKVLRSKCSQKRRAKGSKAKKRVCSKFLSGEADVEKDDDDVEDDVANDGGNGNVVESTSTMIESMGAVEQTAAVNMLTGSNLGGKGNILVGDPLLTCLTVCFRELGLLSILLGLQGHIQPPEDFRLTDESTLIESSLPEALNSIYNVSGVKHFGREKSPDTPLNWTTIAYLLNELKLKADHLCGVDLKSSAGWYSFELFDAISSQLQKFCLLAIIPCLVRIVGRLTCYFKDIRSCDTTLPEVLNLNLHPAIRLLADCLSTALYCLVGFTMGFLPSVNSIRSPDILLSKTSSHEDISCLTRLQCLAECLDDPDHNALLPNEAKELPPVCLLEEDVLGITMENVQSEKGDRKPVADQILRIIQWLVDSSPGGIPHSPCAFVHSCFVLSLARYLNNSISAEKYAVYGHQTLVNYTNALLNMAWDTTAVWQGNSHKDCLSILLALQIHSPFFGSSINPLADCLEILINLSKLHLRPFLRKGDGLSRKFVDSTDDEGESGEENTRLVYKGLNAQSVKIYARKVLDAFCSCLRRLAKHTSASGNAGREDLLSLWCASLEVLTCIIEATKGDSPSRAFLDLLPCLLRAGKAFLEHLLRGAMSFLNSLFRTHGSAVLTFLRNVQKITRFLQRTCVHAKTRHEARLTPLIPQTRKCLEAFVYGVKLLLSQNHCADAFWLGNLKNRDLDGREIHDAVAEDVVVSTHNSAETVASSSGVLNDDGFSIDAAPATASEMDFDMVEDTLDDEEDSLEDDGEADNIDE